jgi:hypothetical protein
MSEETKGTKIARENRKRCNDLTQEEREALLTQAALSVTRGLESDSIVAACNCLTKTPEVEHHKPGCKYRLIMERDMAREEAKSLGQVLDNAVVALKESKETLLSTEKARANWQKVANERGEKLDQLTIALEEAREVLRPFALFASPDLLMRDDIMTPVLERGVQALTVGAFQLAWEAVNPPACPKCGAKVVLGGLLCADCMRKKQEEKL